MKGGQRTSSFDRSILSDLKMKLLTHKLFFSPEHYMVTLRVQIRLFWQNTSIIFPSDIKLTQKFFLNTPHNLSQLI